MMRAVDAAFSGWQHARLAAIDAEIARLQAYIRWQDAYIDSCKASLEIERALATRFLRIASANCPAPPEIVPAVCYVFETAEGQNSGPFVS